MGIQKNLNRHPPLAKAASTATRSNTNSFLTNVNKCIHIRNPLTILSLAHFTTCKYSDFKPF